MVWEDWHIYLAAAGIGTINIIDCDTVSRPDLNRQIIYKETEAEKTAKQRPLQLLHLIPQSPSMSTTRNYVKKMSKTLSHKVML